MPSPGPAPRTDRIVCQGVPGRDGPGLSTGPLFAVTSEGLDLAGNSRGAPHAQDGPRQPLGVPGAGAPLRVLTDPHAGAHNRAAAEPEVVANANRLAGGMRVASRLRLD